ncbi:MAG TPA: glycogen debranching N-terminal domain-containing protein [Kineosporiaceae bacterium]
MTDAWNFDGSPPSDEAHSAVTLVEGSTFCIGSSNGDISPGTIHGLFFRDTRILSRWELRIDGRSPDTLVVQHDAPFSASFVCRTPPRAGRADSTLLVVRRRYVGDGMREDVVLENLSNEAAACTVTILADFDFADLFEVKENRVGSGMGRISNQIADGLLADYRWMGASRGVRVSAEPTPDYAPGLISFQVVVPARGTWEACVQVQASVNDTLLPGRHACGQPVGVSRPDQLLSAWRAQGPAFSQGPRGLLATLKQSQEDLGVLRIFDHDHPERVAVAAGAPWFMSLFGRDSLLSAWMALPIDYRLAVGTLQTLSHYQGDAVNPMTEEQPGRIMHEMRTGMSTALALGGKSVYYGTADATPLFVMLLDEVRRWGAPAEDVIALLPAADRALAWVREYGDADGDGFVEYRRATDRGLVNQGWKDSWDGVNFASGRLADAPIALCEVQGYTYAAYQARARLAQAEGHGELAQEWAERAEKLKSVFNNAFWLPDRGYFAIALDGDKRPVDALASNIAHCLWTGIVDDDKAESVVRHLMSPEMFSGWGIRTLASSMGAYNPMSYHNGSVWPHDNAIAVAGLVRYGFVSEAQTVAMAILDAAETFGGRLPELFCGFERDRFTAPVGYPTSCAPQAWAAATPMSLLRSLLRLEPSLPEGRLTVAPVVPESLLPLRIENLRLGDGVLSLDLRPEGNSIRQAPDGLIVQLAAGTGQRAAR